MGVNITEATLDDILREVLTQLLANGEMTSPTKGPALDTVAASLTLTNPRARLSRSEGRGRIFSCLGELCWYLSGSNDTERVAYYIPTYRDYDEDGKIHGGYGPRLFAPQGTTQIEYVIEKLRANPDSRKAVIQLFDETDVSTHHEDVPCTCTLQFLVRGGQLHLVTYMRSNDAWLGLPHDVFCFTMIQEMIAVSIGAPLGQYSHFIGSLHLYERNIEAARAFLGEGWYSRLHEMPPMPDGDTWGSAKLLIEFEEHLRGQGLVPQQDPSAAPYWADLERVLAVHTLARNADKDSISHLQSQMSSRIYDLFIAERLDKI